MSESTNHAKAANAANTPVLALENVTAAYGRVTVLRDINLEVRPGHVDALIGANGAGKTTLLRVAAGLLKPTSGAVRINGDAMTNAAPHARTRAGLCLIPEGRGVWPGLTVRDNLRLQIPPWSQNKHIDKALAAFPAMKKRLNHLAGAMSGGEQQMVAMARCYLSDPAIVLLDEPSMGLAPKIVEDIFESLQHIASTGVAVLLVEQYVNRALEISDRVHLLKHGEMVFSGNSSDLDEDEVVRGYLGGEIDPETSHVTTV